VAGTPFSAAVTPNVYLTGSTNVYPVTVTGQIVAAPPKYTALGLFDLIGWTVTNAGTPQGNGIFLGGGGVVENLATGAITGGPDAISAVQYVGEQFANEVVNYGSIGATDTTASALGVVFQQGGTVINHSGGIITSTGVGIVH
jgi:hypothetical protein